MNARLAVLAAGVACLLLSDSVAQAQRIAGHVLAADSTPATDVAVLMADSAGRVVAHTITDQMGRFTIDWVPGARRISIARIGSRPAIVMLPGSPRDTSIDIVMQPAVVPSLDTVRATSDMVNYFSPLLQEFEIRRVSGSGHFISDMELRRYDNSSLANVLPARVPGLRLIWYKSSTYVASTRGGTKRRADPYDARSPMGCWVSVAIDGQVIYKGPPFAPPDMTRLQVVEFAGVEFYEGSSTIPPKFAGQNSSCGLLLLWSREK